MNRSIFQTWSPFFENNDINLNKIKTINLNFGPQHPAAHGVLRLILQLNGEIVERVDPHVGLLHRGSEKLMEDKLYIQALPYYDRFDYVSMLAQEHAYCLAVEYLLGTTNFTSTFTQIRVLYDELTRILNHMLGIACHALDVGSMSSVFWAFEEREKIMEFYERVSGARMHAAFYRPNEINTSAVTPLLLEDIAEFTRNCFTTLNEMHNILTYNKIWKQRLVGIGSISYKTCRNFGLTGVLSRSTGIKRDLRLSKLETYANYYSLFFRSFLGQHGDSYDRFLIRMSEMGESLNIINQVLNLLVITNNKNTNNKNKLKPDLITNFLKPKNVIQSTLQNTIMEQTINHFKNWQENLNPAAGWTYQSIESPKGEFGVSILSNNTNKPFRVKVRSPAYHSMQLYSEVTRGHFLADLVTLIGTIDIVFGEVDR